MQPRLELQETSHPRQPTSQQRWGWYLFDFANSILIINGTLYFPQWLVIDNKVPDSIYNLTAILVSALLIISGPFFGTKADKHKKCFFYLTISSLSLFLSALALSFGALFFRPGSGRSLFCLICFGAVLYFYQLSLVFYNAMLRPLTTTDGVSKISGLGLAWGWIGGIAAVIAIAPVVNGQLLFHTPNKMNALLPSAIAFGILTAISLFLMRKLEGQHSTLLPTSDRSLFSTLTDLKTLPVLSAFILAFFLYSDAILTLENNVTIFMEQVFGIGDDIKAILFVLFLLFGAISAGTEWKLTSAAKSLRTLRKCMWGWMLALATAALAPNNWTFYIIFLIMGVLYGILYNSSRVLFFQLIPKERIAEYFGLYASFERFASIIGPLIWSLPLLFRPQEDALGYRMAVASLILPIIVSICLLQFAYKKLDIGLKSTAS